MELTATVDAHPGRLLADVIQGLAMGEGARTALLSDRETLTYSALSARINQYARWAIASGIAKGDTVGLMMPNRVDYLAIWLGITRVGGIVALLNTQLTGSSLAHCIKVANARHVIVDAALQAPLMAAVPLLEVVPAVWTCGAGTERRIDVAAGTLDGAPLRPEEDRGVTIHDRALLIYTSGTTGLPKAAHVSHRRILNWAFWFAGLIDAAPEDRMYDCLPLYHSVGGVVATGCMLVAGGSVVIAEKFSATSFWDDIARWQCTAFQYIGELCRYVLKAPASPNEQAHRLRVICGNGLRGEIWEAFKARFAIPRILEFYAATEGNFSLFNVEEKVGAIGRIPSFLTHRFPAAVVRFDVGACVPLRNAQGFCERCAADEVGEAIGRIGERDEGGGQFEGYTSAAETEGKILRNVFKPGDAWFRTGDLMRRDAQGFFYFVDRIGDTFRWKGENVATLEVAEIVAGAPGVVEATVYGVAVPGTDGRAGMAAIVIAPSFDVAAFRRYLTDRLPSYAVPVFVRILPRLAITETFKQKKQELMREGFDASAPTDPLYVNDPASAAYVALDSNAYQRIVAGKVRL